MSSEPPPEEIVEAIERAIRGGRKIEAIRLLREHSGKGLAEAKEFIEKLTEQLYERDPESFSVPPAKSGSGCGTTSAACLLLATLLLVAAMAVVR